MSFNGKLDGKRNGPAAHVLKAIYSLFLMRTTNDVNLGTALNNYDNIFLTVLIVWTKSGMPSKRPGSVIY